jgi:hypothetical protein
MKNAIFWYGKRDLSKIIYMRKKKISRLLSSTGYWTAVYRNPIRIINPTWFGLKKMKKTRSDWNMRYFLKFNKKGANKSKLNQLQES